MNYQRLVKSPQEQLRDRDFVKYCANVLKKIKIDYEITNVELGKRSGLDPAYASKTQNGTVNQKNYIRIIRGLPEAARRDYVQKIFFDPIPELLPSDVRDRIDKKVRERKNAKSKRSVPELESAPADI